MADDEEELRTGRLVLGPWTAGDTEGGVAIFGREEVTRWLNPAMSPVPDAVGMAEVMQRWAEQDAEAEPPVGHWAVRRADAEAIIGSITLRRMPPHEIDLELAWQFVPEEWGNGYATEAAAAVATWAFQRSAHEVFAVMRPANAASERLARRLGMQWVGETDKYYDLRLQVFRLRPPDLVTPTSR